MAANDSEYRDEINELKDEIVDLKSELESLRDSYKASAEEADESWDIVNSVRDERDEIESENDNLRGTISLMFRYYYDDLLRFVKLKKKDDIICVGITESSFFGKEKDGYRNLDKFERSQMEILSSLLECDEEEFDERVAIYLTHKDKDTRKIAKELLKRFEDES